MAVSIPISITRKFSVQATPAEVHRLLANVPESVSHFPKVENLVDLGDGKFRWEMQKLGTSQVSLQIIYACEYVSKPAEGSISWTPVAGVGNGQIRGQWKIRARDGGGTHVDFATTGELTLPLPKLLAGIAKPVVAGEFSGLVDSYIRNLTKTLGPA
jgi:carbon monoxide dehydrogenase subunit G